MATVTPNIRYISLFTALRRLRQDAGETEAQALPLRDYWRRAEALIAAASVLHHEDGDVPPGIVGRRFADEATKAKVVKLVTGLANPPYNIYRGSLAGLGLFDLAHDSDPLFERARPLGEAWNPGTGKLARDIGAGILPSELARDVIRRHASDFCICKVPGRAEQRELIRLLYGFGTSLPPPSFDLRDSDPVGMRVVSWRLLLELVHVSPDVPVDAEFMMARLLESDVLDLRMPEPFIRCLLAWRWVAARSFFERGWTYTFNRTLAHLKNVSAGYSPAELAAVAQEDYLRGHVDERVEELVLDSEFRDGSVPPLVQMFDQPTKRDCLRLIIAGISAAERDKDRSGLPLLAQLFGEGAIPFALEDARIEDKAQAGAKASELYADLSGRTLVEHTRSALRRMSQGGPDSLHVDFDSGRWLVPSKALNWNPTPAGAFSRLDIGLGWATQLGLISWTDGGYRLSPLGSAVRKEWDQENTSWE